MNSKEIDIFDSEYKRKLEKLKDIADSKLKLSNEELIEMCEKDASLLLTIIEASDENSYIQNSEMMELGFNNRGKDIFIKRLVAKRKSLRNRKLAIAVSSIASAVIALSMVVYSYIERGEVTIQVPIQVAKVAKTEIITPTLITDNGKAIKMEVANSTSSIVNIMEVAQNVAKDTVSVETKYNRYVVPAKYTSKVVLDDGTIVHLNGGSELLFPEQFNGNERRVELIGEGYFEVAKSANRFVVSANGLDVAVYGTKFNVNATTKDVVQTVLVEGSVGVIVKGKALQLNPNELCIANLTSGDVTKESVRIDKYISWVSGRFMFERDNLETILNQLSQWYGVEFIMTNKKLNEESITTIISKDTELEEVLELLSKLNINIKFIKTNGGYMVK